MLLFESDDRLLLFRYTSDEGERFWCPAGGGVEAGEMPEEAVQREIAEETGATDLVDLYRIAYRRHVVPMFGELVDAREHWFVGRVGPLVIDTDGWSELERSTISAHRWWTAADLHAAQDRLVPEDLASVVDKLLLEGGHRPSRSPTQRLELAFMARDFATPEEAALDGWPESARVHVVEVTVAGDWAEVVLDTEPSYPYWVYCARRAGRWVECGSANGPNVGWEDLELPFDA